MSDDDFLGEILQQLVVAVPRDPAVATAAIMDVARLTKESLVANGPEDLSPLLIYATEVGAAISTAPFTTDNVPVELALTLGSMRRSLGAPPIWVVLVTEIWRKIVPEEQWNDIRRGDARRAFFNGTGVEALSVYVVTAEASHFAMQVFRYGDGGIEWGPYEADGKVDEGHSTVHQVLRAQFVGMGSENN